MENKNMIMYDWVSFTSKIHGPDGIIELLGLDGDNITWELTKGAHGYRDRLYWERISIHFNGRDDMGVWCEMSGQGCRAFETFGNGNYDKLFTEILDNPGDMHLTRLDVAFDDHSGLLDIAEVCQDVRDQSYVSRFRGWQVVDSDGGSSATLGSRSSEILVRIYDKAAERGFVDGRHWVRVELQLRRDRAEAFVLAQGDVGYKFAGVLTNYVRFVDVPDDSVDNNRWRWPCKAYWAALVDGAQRIRLWSAPGTDYNMVNLETFVEQQCAGAVYTYLETHGVDEFLAKMRHRTTPLNPKYKQLIAEYGRDKA